MSWMTAREISNKTIGEVVLINLNNQPPRLHYTYWESQILLIPPHVIGVNSGRKCGIPGKENIKRYIAKYDSEISQIPDYPGIGAIIKGRIIKDISRSRLVQKAV